MSNSIFYLKIIYNLACQYIKKLNGYGKFKNYIKKYTQGLYE